MTMRDSIGLPFGAPATDARAPEWKRLGLFVAIGAAFFLIAVVGTAFVPFGWPDAIRRSVHPTIFVPLGLLLTVRFLRRDAREMAPASLFNPWLVGRASVVWLILGIALAGIIVLTFAVAFGLRWAPNAHWSGPGIVLSLWAILVTAAAEEISFRGYALWRLMRLIGFWPAQTVVAILFTLSHFTLGGYTLLPALIGTVTGSILYGVTFARTRGLAAPIALHSGWNIAQHLLLSPLNPSATPLVPTFPHPPTAWEYGSMVTIIGIVMVAATIGILTTKKLDILEPERNAP
jgi:membrane protease YdiL (CAAX protease family)